MTTGVGMIALTSDPWGGVGKITGILTHQMVSWCFVFEGNCSVRGTGTSIGS